jgi:hypothetical protein
MQTDTQDIEITSTETDVSFGDKIVQVTGLSMAEKRL